MSDSTKERMLDAGLSMLLRHGYNDLGVQAVLKQTRMPKGSFYHHFTSKEDFATDRPRSGCSADARA